MQSSKQRFVDLLPDATQDVGSDEFAAGRRQLLATATLKRFTSATAIGQLKKEEKADDTEPWSRGRGGTRLGRAVHAAIQSVPLDANDATIAAFARAQAVAEAIPHRTAEVEKLVRWVLRESKAAERARRAQRALREVPFAVQVDGTVLEGFIDLLIEASDGGIEVVDWKTDQIGESEVGERLKEYEIQAGLYVYGIEAATRRKVSAVTYVFAGPGVERSPGNPAELSSAALAALQTTAEVVS
jgi:ATP-dependent helicase/nuclease subunit A